MMPVQPQSTLAGAISRWRYKPRAFKLVPTPTPSNGDLESSQIVQAYTTLSGFSLVVFNTLVSGTLTPYRSNGSI